VPTLGCQAGQFMPTDGLSEFLNEQARAPAPAPHARFDLRRCHQGAKVAYGTAPRA
jgi:hypothetical protein